MTNHFIYYKCFFFNYLSKCVILYYNAKLAYIYNVHIGVDHGRRILTVYYSSEVVSAHIKALPARVIV